jgi:hypothetical protein
MELLDPFKGPERDAILEIVPVRFLRAEDSGSGAPPVLLPPLSPARGILLGIATKTATNATRERDPTCPVHRFDRQAHKFSYAQQNIRTGALWHFCTLDLSPLCFCAQLHNCTRKVNYFTSLTTNRTCT